RLVVVAPALPAGGADAAAGGAADVMGFGGEMGLGVCGALPLAPSRWEGEELAAHEASPRGRMTCSAERRSLMSTSAQASGASLRTITNSSSRGFFGSSTATSTKTSPAPSLLARMRT